jgi:hypothetical protein
MGLAARKDMNEPQQCQEMKQGVSQGSLGPKEKEKEKEFILRCQGGSWPLS